MPQIASRFRMPEPDGTYHSPIIMSPNGYSVWASA
jgi:5-hydroxyisourate hydrolase